MSDAEIEAIYRAGRFGKLPQADRALDCRSGTTEDLFLAVTPVGFPTVAPPSLQLFAGDTFVVSMTTPAETFALTPYGILAQPYLANAPPVGLASAPDRIHERVR